MFTSHVLRVAPFIYLEPGNAPYRYDLRAGGKLTPVDALPAAIDAREGGY